MVNGGIPDFSAFHFTFLNILSEEGLFSKGMCIEEFGLLFFKGISKPSKQTYKYDLKIGEVKVNKSSKPQILKQLTQYEQTKLSNELFGIIPDEISGFSIFGLMNFVNNLKYERKIIPTVNVKLREKDDLWLKLYVKILLLSNLDMDIVKKFVSDNIKILPANIGSRELLSAVINVDDSLFIKFIKENLKNGLHK